MAPFSTESSSQLYGGVFKVGGRREGEKREK
jgi:hypothetical protein